MKKIIRICIVVFLLVIMGTTVYAASMTYHSNSVSIIGANGIQITGGTFKTNELSITSGQDPDQLNKVGQTYQLDNGQLTFEVGRKGSSEVASWYNERLSGYNDPSINGDRTTFDHTADDLNFAFIGNLNLTLKTSDYPQGIAVHYPNVAFAQGHSGTSNNWWFGQLKGQHTKDSDGTNTVLVIGEDGSGNTVFASFLRGDNSVNEVSLQALSVVGEAKDRPTQMTNIAGAFSSLPINGSPSNLGAFPGNYDSISCHIQGYAQYTNANSEVYGILTHSVSTAAYGHIVAGAKNGNSTLGFKTYLENWPHPGGIQTIGDYLLVPTEQDSEAHISLYDLRALSVGELRKVESFDLKVDHKAGALGITTYSDANGVEYYLLVVANLDNENSVYHIYRAPVSKGLESANFTKVGSFGLSKDFQGFGLITEAGTQKVYLVGLWSKEESLTYADYTYLYQLSTQNWTIGSELNTLHLVSTVGGISGVHFRYGAGVFVTPDQQLVISATERNGSSINSMAINNWSGKAD